MVAMSSSKLKKPPKKSNNLEDLGLLKAEVASFASSLGLSSSLPPSGFNDSDFRKKGPLKPHTKIATQNKSSSEDALRDKPRKPKDDGPLVPRPNPKPKPKAPVLTIEDGVSRDRYAQGASYGKFRNLPKLPLVKASALGIWYTDANDLEAKVIGDRGKRVEVSDVEVWKVVVEEKRKLGEGLMAQYAQDYESSRGESADIKMLVMTQRSGTAADKVSAFSVMVGDNPIANLRSLDGLVGMVTSKVGKRHALTGFEVLKDLFISSLLPDRKLKTLLQRPLNHLPETKDGNSLLLFWYWEDCLKQRYERFIFALEEASRDMLPILKDKALKTMYLLLKSKPEQERRLLSALVNKLGDPENKSASSADFHLSNLLSEHRNMTPVVIDEVDSFLFRPRLGLRAQYHAINFLSQIRLSHTGDGPKVAKRLIDVYFAVFKVLITEAGSIKENDEISKKQHKKASTFEGKKVKNASQSHVELDSRILSVLLTGVNRAFPYVSSNEADDIIEVQTPLLFQLVHSKNFNVGIQALMLLDKISSKNQIVSDRFYRALYSKLLLPAAMNTSKAEMFIGLLLRAIKNDVNLKRVAAFSKRLLQVALQQPPQYACGYLFLLSEVLKARPPLWNMVLQGELVDEELEHFEDIVEEVDEDINISREENKIGSNADHDSMKDNESSEEEDGSPVSSSNDELSDEADDLLLKNVSQSPLEVEVSVNEIDRSSVSSKERLLAGGYNPRHREPSYCNADRASWWELSVLASHVHPSVSTMAGTLLSGSNIVYDGNPLNDLSLIAFLDKLMEKKPKTSSWHGGSQIEPAKKINMNNLLIGPELLSLAEMEVPPEDLVFHKFYMNKMNSSKKQKKKKRKGAEEEAAEELFDVDDGEVEGGDESDNEEIENMLDTADISLNGDGEYDYDDLDQVAADDDDDLVGDASETEMDFEGGDKDDVDLTDNDRSDDEEDNNYGGIAIGDAEDDTDEAEDGGGGFHQRKGKRKSRGKTSASPFASLEEYEHLLNEDLEGPEPHKSTKRKSKLRKKKRSLK